MAYSIGEVEAITQVKQHVLRYWETVIPGSAPQKDVNGRRSYTHRDVELILRLKYLIEEKKYTIEGARKQMIEETEHVADKAELLEQVHTLRVDLAEAFLLMRKYRRRKSEG